MGDACLPCVGAALRAVCSPPSRPICANHPRFESGADNAVEMKTGARCPPRYPPLSPAATGRCHPRAPPMLDHLAEERHHEDAVVVAPHHVRTGGGDQAHALTGAGKRRDHTGGDQCVHGGGGVAAWTSSIRRRIRAPSRCGLTTPPSHNRVETIIAIASQTTPPCRRTRSSSACTCPRSRGTSTRC